jgi:hypothetical protein
LALVRCRQRSPETLLEGQEEAARPQHAGGLAERTVQVVDVLERGETEDAVKGLRLER